MEKKLDNNYTRMLWVILNNSLRQHLTKQQLYGHLPPIMKTVQVRWTSHVGHCWRSRGELISDILLWTPAHGRAKAGQPARTYIQQLCAYTRCSLEDLLGVMDNREGWRERVREIHAGSATWWYIYIYANTHMHLNIYTYADTHLYLSIYLPTHIHVHIYIYKYTCTYTHTYIYIYMPTHTNTHTHIYIYICQHTHIYMHV